MVQAFSRRTETTGHPFRLYGQVWLTPLTMLAWKAPWGSAGWAQTGQRMNRHIGAGFLIGDGHCSFAPDQEWMRRHGRVDPPVTRARLG